MELVRICRAEHTFQVCMKCDNHDNLPKSRAIAMIDCIYMKIVVKTVTSLPKNERLATSIKWFVRTISNNQYWHLSLAYKDILTLAYKDIRATTSTGPVNDSVMYIIYRKMTRANMLQRDVNIVKGHLFKFSKDLCSERNWIEAFTPNQKNNNFSCRNLFTTPLVNSFSKT